MKITEIEEVIKLVIQEVLQELSETAKSKPKFAIAFLNQAGSSAAFNKVEIAELAEITSYENSFAQALFVNYLTLQQLVAISNLQDIDHLSRVVNKFLLEGKTVWVKATELNLPEVRQKAKYQVYQRMVEIYQRCQNYGVEFEFSKEALIQLKRKKSTGIRPKQIATQRYLTEKDVQKMLATEELNLEGMRLTPLAKDFVNQFNAKQRGG